MHNARVSDSKVHCECTLPSSDFRPISCVAIDTRHAKRGCKSGLDVPLTERAAGTQSQAPPDFI